MNELLFKGLRVTVVGMGRSGLAAARLLSKQGALPLIIDDKPQTIPPDLPASIQFNLGNWHEEDLTSADLIVLSPGVPRNRIPTDRLESLGIPLISEVELAASLLKAPIIGITGTNGKSTTTTLVGEILKGWGWQTFVGGNLGLPLSEAVSSSWDFIVAELSSFQLETITRFHPRLAILLNISADHLDRYKEYETYKKAKWRIFENQSQSDHAILNLDDPLSLPPKHNAQPVYFSQVQVVERGVYLQDGEIISSLWGEPEAICHLDDLHVTPACHPENILAACAVTLLAGCSIEAIAETLRHFKGLPHRMEFVREYRGVQYLNDSKGTNVAAVKRALEGLKQPVILIAGGRDKAGDFESLKKVVGERAKRLILIGETQEKMARIFSDHRAIEKADSMEAAVNAAAAAAQPGETVLLSPGCASFDLFGDYQERGDVFKEAVMGLS